MLDEGKSPHLVRMALDFVHERMTGIIIADYRTHTPGEREVVDWTRLNGIKYCDVPLMFLREATREEYLTLHPGVDLEPWRDWYFWEVSVD